MKITGTLSFFLLPLALCAGPITQKPLDEFVIYDIPVASKSGTTTVMFPLEISGLFAKSVAAQEQENAGWLRLPPGRKEYLVQGPCRGTIMLTIG